MSLFIPSRPQQAAKIRAKPATIAQNKKSRVAIKWQIFKKYYKPNKIFSIWKVRYTPPWLCILEFLILLLFIFLTIGFQQITIPFFQDFGTAIDNYFLEGYDITEEDSTDYGDSRIYTQEVFLDMFNATVYRYFDFAANFPCSYQLIQATNLSVTINYHDEYGNRIWETTSFDDNNKSKANDLASKYIYNFHSIELYMLFTIVQVQHEYNQYLAAGVTSSFDNYMQTGIILWDCKHERSAKQFDLNINNTRTNLITSISITIISFLILCIILQLFSIYKLYAYSKIKAKSERITPFSYFKMKLDMWEVATLVINANSLLSMIIYIANGQNVNENFPWPHFLLAWASFFHPFILYRYLQLNPSTFIVVRMIINGSITLLQFLMGCIPFFIGFLILGVSCFGWYSPIMTSNRRAAQLLIAASYGDYLLDGYDGLTDFADKDEIIPSLFLTIWIFNGLGIWFYVVLAILQATLIKEVHKARDEDIEDSGDEEKMDAEDPLPWLQFVNER